MLPEANAVHRETVPASHRVVGLHCGGSDGYSGISANPVLGVAVDLVVRHGGTAILSEPPEIFGGEHLLLQRAVSQAVADKPEARLSRGQCIACRAGKTNCCVRIQVLGVHRDGDLTKFLSVPQAFVHEAEGVCLDQAAMVKFLAIGAHAVHQWPTCAGGRRRPHWHGRHDLCATERRHRHGAGQPPGPTGFLYPFLEREPRRVPR